MSIRQAAIASQIYYPTAKAINKIYMSEKRVDKKKSRFRKIACSRPKTAQKQQNEVQNSGMDSQAVDENTATKEEKLTMLKPIREELSLGPEIYESLDEDMIDVTLERIEEARQQNMPFDHFRLCARKA